MTDEEVREFLEQTRTIILCSIGKDGSPHPMPMWFGLEEDGTVVMTTFTKSQKIRNLKRDSRVSLLAEAGETYSELRGVMIRGRAEVDTEVESVFATLRKVSVRMGTIPGEDSEAIREGLRASAKKRCLIRVKPEKVVSWDHRKLGGVY
jgi:PPOX class probable F420-dependent enzyme